ncbi:MAG TPA: magnesium/cobalt transporter CorA [Gammaproteobacteria bacterium]
MIRAFVSDRGRLLAAADSREALPAAVWTDLVEPTAEERAALESMLQVALPTREEMEEIELSSRLYQENDAAFMTALFPSRTDTDDLLMGPVTFVLAGGKLVTVRHHTPRVFEVFPRRAEKVNLGCSNAEAVLLSLLEAMVDRLADVLERGQREVDRLSNEIFRTSTTPGDEIRPLRHVLEEVGRKGTLISNLGNSLLTFRRVAGFLRQVMLQRGSNAEMRERVATLARDIQSLSDHDEFLSQKVTFLLDATLGMINIEQNGIIRIFTVAAAMFLPPTLVASVYGMNFAHMPELGWVFGYPFALSLMVLSAVLPYWFFKRRGWL